MAVQLQIILGNQLFPIHYYSKQNTVFMCEDRGLCTHFRYHKHKIILFLASMRNYRDDLVSKHFKVEYHSLDKSSGFFVELKNYVEANKISVLKTYEIEDKFFEQEMIQFAQKQKIELLIEKTPLFLVSREEFKKYLKSVKKPFMKSFYEGLRNSTGILMTKGSAPQGGKYSFDKENRKKIPKKFEVIKNEMTPSIDQNTSDVKKLVEREFPDHPGHSDKFWMATTRKDVLKHYKVFLDERFSLFGDFEDAIDSRDPFLYHSVISPYLNMGLITPEETIKLALQADVPLNSKEGFIRQVLGWREFVRGIYQEFSERQESRNFFDHQNKLSSAWYEGGTGIPPLDETIQKVLKFGYCHHIERLMILSNIMLLCEIKPSEVYRWFMEMFVDSSDWVMGPNVYGMAQFSDGGIFATKPYISGSNYLRKMGHYSKGPWCEVLDGLYWRFIARNRTFFQKNYRMAMMVKLLDKKDPSELKELITRADLFIEKVTD